MIVDFMDQDQLKQARDLVLDHVIEEAKELGTETEPAYDKVFVGGFSQGSLLTLATLMRQTERLD